ncbi:MAG: cytochrome b/b6 domain-containing protein [Gemmatimonadetes bacterium]|nr:cytochrome b/b6 domain-containing protein [Gemmatimonadota bacterium]
MVTPASRARGLLLVAALLVWAPPTGAETIPTSDCLECHGDRTDEDTPFVTEATLEPSVHAGFDCVDCHSDIAELPHDEELAPVSCGQCHEDEVEVYKMHGRVAVGADPDIPTCASCHGSHDIRPSNDEASWVNPRNLPDTCGNCHRDTDLAKLHDIKLKRPVEVYETSVHGRATLGGSMTFAATCNDCHSSGGTAHRILGPGNPESTINHFNIPATCGRCHESIEREYRQGIHGQLTERGETDSPVCTTCHGEHGILPHSDPRARVSPTHVAEATCAPCHESAFLNEKYGLPAGRLASFVDSYHGLKSKAGDTRVANCASCHGAHRILPSADERSTVNPANLVNTCGSCHPGIDTALATTKIHETGPGERTGFARLFTRIYLVLIVLIIGGMLLYVTLDWLRQLRSLPGGRQVARMSPNAIAQHAFLAVTFVTLVVSGFALRYNESWLFQMLFGWDGGSTVRGFVHRTAAVVFTATCIWHLFYLRTTSGRRFFRDMWPTLEDFGQFTHMMQYNLGKRDDRPKFRRFGYVEKAEYWALLWGAVVMFVTGVFLWFDNRLVHWVPKGALDVMLVIHFYEAVLATLAIAVWHLYSTVFNPAIYPGNPAWITGKMPEEMHHHEHGGEHVPPEAPAEPA